MKKKITINDIAKLSKTSKTTVSFYINGKTSKMSLSTQKQIQDVIDKTNYSPSVVARSLNSKNMNLIGVITGDITNSFANQIVKGIDSYAAAHEYQLILGNSNYDNENEIKYVKRMLAMGVDGFIVQPTLKFEKIIHEIEKYNKPIVYIDSPLANDEGLFVKTNNFVAVYQSMEKMIKEGYKKFIMIGADTSVLNTRIQRSKGFIQCMDDNSMDYINYLISNEVNIVELEEFFEKNLDLNIPTLIFVPNCWGLPIVFNALKKYRKYFPNALGLVGFDNLDWSELSAPSVTTIVQPAFDEGVNAAKIVIDKIQKTDIYTDSVTLDCVINELESTKKS